MTVSLKKRYYSAMYFTLYSAPRTVEDFKVI